MYSPVLAGPATRVTGRETQALEGSGLPEIAQLLVVMLCLNCRHLPPWMPEMWRELTFLLPSFGCREDPVLGVNDKCVLAGLLNEVCGH